MRPRILQRCSCERTTRSGGHRSAFGLGSAGTAACSMPRLPWPKDSEGNRLPVRRRARLKQTKQIGGCGEIRLQSTVPKVGARPHMQQEPS